MPVPRIDHVVVDVADRIEEAAQRYRALGFHLTKRARHSLGSSNHLSMFDPDYVELLSPGDGRRQDLAGFPVGLNGLVFAMEGAEAVRDSLRARGLPVQEVQRFSRTVELSDGERRDARFNVVRLEPRTVFDGRVYFCEHLTPELVWRPEWQAHPNGALALARIALSSQDPNRVAEVFDRMFGAGTVERATQHGPHVLRAGEVAVEIWPGEELGQTLGAAMPDPVGRGDHMALLGIRVRSLRRTLETLRASGIRNVAAEAGRVLVPPTEAMNVTLEFNE
jgi:hypothetical protein